MIEPIPYTSGYDLIQWPLYIEDLQKREDALKKATEELVEQRKMRGKIKEIFLVWKEEIK